MRGAKPERALEEALAERVAAGASDVLLAAVSGGPDSVALAALLARHAEGRGARVVLAHVNHGLRSSAGRDEAVVLALGTTLRLRVVTRALAPGAASEARLRTARYAVLASIARSVGARRILTAHHAGDQAETVLLALFRGTGPAGLAGIAPVRPMAGGLTLERPLLAVPKADLIAYCAARALPYALDPSNDDTAYRRNAVRAALAGLRQTFPRLDAAVARCAALVRDEEAGNPRALLRRTLREEVEGAAGDLRDVTFERIEAVARAVERRRPGRHHLRPGVEVTLRRTP
ncbi:MAG: tRNA lysidine(34) synthetase TilS [Candidatus Eremiobacteraeota bacterium]|nr:tRNA lysidine(34) synthetase TilS [Candidatus Eremiobacteraeota bacterium]